jgi:hypothetical protein
MDNYQLSLEIGKFLEFEPLEILIDWAEQKATVNFSII